MDKHMNFRFQDVIVIVCAVAMLFSAILPAWKGSAGTSRVAVCMNNMKLIGVGLENWRRNAQTGRYPFWDLPGFDGTSDSDLNPWCEMIGMVYPFTPEIIEAERDYLEYIGMPPEDFSKTVDSMKIFRCPADHPHPHKINKDRANEMGVYKPFEYSYTLNVLLTHPPVLARDASSQVLSADGVWTWGHNLSAHYIGEPAHPWNYPGWWSNTVGYFHKNDSANLVLRDGHVENHRWDPAEGLPDTEDIYFGEPGESHDAHYY